MNGLVGKRVLVTRAREQAAGFCDALRARGAEPILFPTIAVRPADDMTPVDDAIGALNRYVWVVFTSANGVRFFVDRLHSLRGEQWPEGARVAAVGASTARALEQRGVRVDAVPEEFRGDRLAEVLGDVHGHRVLLPRADIGRDATAESLRAVGAVVDDLIVYHTIPDRPRPDAIAALRNGFDIATFTSPSTVRNLVAQLGDEAYDLLSSATVACIGPVTADAARALGIRVDVQPNEYTIDALVQSLASLGLARDRPR